MTIRIVTNKRLDMTDDEFSLYNRIVNSYTINNNNGEDLFEGLFESDEKGNILLLVPPSAKKTSFEVWLYLMSLQQNQQLRLMRNLIDHELNQIKKIAINAN